MKELGIHEETRIRKEREGDRPDRDVQAKQSLR